ncbi:von Willebrand factor A domain-containing protein 5A, partial [Ophiophagus hannah]
MAKGVVPQSAAPEPRLALVVPLKSISVDVIIRGFVADVVSELQYQNEEKNPVEATFVFPLDDEAAVYAFEGLIGGKRIEAQIREKKQAEQEYDDALSKGHQAFLLGREENTSDIFTCNLGNLPPGEKATLKLRYVQALAVEPDDAVRFVLPAVLNPRYVPEGSEGGTVSQQIPRLSTEALPYALSLSAKVESPYGINRVDSKCSLIQNMSEDRTAAQVSLAKGHQFDRDVELLIYYEDVHKTSTILEAGKSGAAPAAKAGQCVPGEFIFLLDRSGSMGTLIGDSFGSQSRIESAKETLIFLLKSLPLGCYFNIYGFGSTYDSFYPQSVKYTQQTMDTSVQRVKELRCDLGGTEIVKPLKAIYSQPCFEGHPRQIFVFTDGEVCFSFGIGEGASTSLVKGIARAAGGSAEFITGKERMQAKALQSLKKALQPAVSGISLSWELPPGLEAKPVGSGPQVIFQGSLGEGGGKAAPGARDKPELWSGVFPDSLCGCEHRAGQANSRTSPPPRCPPSSSRSRTKEEESPLLKLVSLQNADGSWPHGPALAAILDLSEAEISDKAPTHVTPDIWATVLAILWLHLNAAEKKDEWELLEGKAVHWLQPPLLWCPHPKLTLKNFYTESSKPWGNRGIGELNS